MFDSSVQQAFMVVLILSGIPLVVGSGVALLVSIVQAATQVQEQSIQFIIKLSAVVVVFVLLGRWFLSQLIDLTRNLLSALAYLGTMP